MRSKIGISFVSIHYTHCIYIIKNSLFYARMTFSLRFQLVAQACAMNAWNDWKLIIQMNALALASAHLFVIECLRCPTLNANVNLAYNNPFTLFDENERRVREWEREKKKCSFTCHHLSESCCVWKSYRFNQFCFSPHITRPILCNDRQKRNRYSNEK